MSKQQLWASGHDESVEVNQRSLIDKVLARYSGEFTVFRELLQNSADAGSKSVQIHFETEGFMQRDSRNGEAVPEGDSEVERIPDLKTTPVHQWVFKNDGMTFREEDWARLRKIAEGNPDEEKIGAFGVGFYSLFSITEEPFVTSGDQWMCFYWKDKKDQLFARRGLIPGEDNEIDKWTTFAMPLREPAPMPVPFDFVRFLASSITFVAHLSDVSVWFDGKQLAHIQRERGVPKPLRLKPGLKPDSSKGTMRVTSAQTTPLNIKAEVVRAVYVSGATKARKQVAAPVAQPTTTGFSAGFFSSIFSSFTGSSSRAPTPVLKPDPEVAAAAVRKKEEEEQKSLMQITETSVQLSVFSVDINVTLDDHAKRELLRATKKNPPNHTRLELIYTGKDEYDASRKEDESAPVNTGSIFQGLRADVDGSGLARIFIGHTTGQTTGLGGHIAARFIPTVERESIDLVDRNVRVWNEELLEMGGYLARLAYELELDNIKILWDASFSTPAGKETSNADLEMRRWLYGRALHALKFFTFYASTPAPQVSMNLEEAFFSCAVTTKGFSFLGATTEHTNPFPIMSTIGVRPASEVRMPDEQFATFMKQLPVVPSDIVNGAGTMIGRLKERSMIQNITFKDIIRELSSRPLAEKELIACLKWWVGLYTGSNNPQLAQRRTELLNAAILSIGNDEKGQIIPLMTIQTFINIRSLGASLPENAPLPSHVLPLSISREFNAESLSNVFGWRELSISEWVSHLLNDKVSSANPTMDPTKSVEFAEQLLNILSRSWPNLHNQTKDQVVSLLQSKTCIPTSLGLHKPEQAYFPTVDLFPDLPIVTFPGGSAIKGTLEKLLLALGVRKHVDLQLLFNRMIKTGDWSTSDLIKYLVAVQSTLSAQELERLRLTAAFPREAQESDGTGEKNKIARCKASDLYEPLDTFREMELPVLSWGTKSKWRSSSEEAKFLYRLGLRRYPPLDVVLRLASSTQSDIRGSALKYFLDNFSRHYSDYDAGKFTELAFIPAIKNGKKYLNKPDEVVASPQWSTLGFAITDPTLKADDIRKLGIRDRPSTSSLINYLKTTPPTNVDLGNRCFSLLATRVSDFTPNQRKLLATLPFVPVSSEQKEKPTGSFETLHHEPSVEEITRILLDDPKRFYLLADGRENYLVELRNIAVNRHMLPVQVLNKMKLTPMLLGSRRTKRNNKTTASKPGDLDEDEDWDVEYELLKADSIVIADDTNAYQQFGDSVFSAPQEDLLEEFYSTLGSRRLSTLVQEQYTTTSEVRGAKRATETRSLILERLPLFLHEHTHAQTRIPYSWLNKDANFIVRTFGKITIVKSFKFGQLSLVKSQDASAVALQKDRGPIQLWLAGNDQVDMYEVSTSICRLLFSSLKASDALLFMTILSTDLRALRRRGYNVDRILRKQRAERQAAEDAFREKMKAEAEANASKAQLRPVAEQEEASEKIRTPLPLPSGLHQSSPSNQVNPTSKSSDTLVNPENPPQVDPKKNPSRPMSLFGESLGNLRKKLASKSEHGDSTPVLHGNNCVVGSQSDVTPRGVIASNIEAALKACRTEKGKSLVNSEHVQQVKESMNDSYCDVSGRVGNLSLVGEMGEIRVFATDDVQSPKNLLMEGKHDALARFIHLIISLAEIYQLPKNSLHVFYDLSGETIAFNRNASLFLNLRYYESWHDAEVAGGVITSALISWYFTLAHEIAHNLVRVHNAEHEFYFSSICEEYMLKLIQKLTS
ncbi:hypothetical protein ABKN59_003690 [Abortiporus biennis]